MDYAEIEFTDGTRLPSDNECYVSISEEGIYWVRNTGTKRITIFYPMHRIKHVKIEGV